MTETKTSGMTFEQALGAMRAGRKVARADWIQKGKWVRLVSSSLQPGHAPYFEFMRGDGQLIPWSISGDSVLNETWYVVE